MKNTIEKISLIMHLAVSALLSSQRVKSPLIISAAIELGITTHHGWFFANAFSKGNAQEVQNRLQKCKNSFNIAMAFIALKCAPLTAELIYSLMP